MGGRLKIVMFRSWAPQAHFGTFSSLETTGIGGTEFQLLLHVRALRKMGHEVTVLGVTRADVVEEETLFQGAQNKEEMRRLLARDHSQTDVVFTNATQDAAELRALMPRAKVVQVCQNGPAFAADRWLDVYGFVGHGQLAYYSGKWKRYRRKFLMLPNVTPWHTYYARTPPQDKGHQVIWVGGFTKQGLRRYAKAMAQLLCRDPSLRWVLCGPSYAPLARGEMPPAIADVRLPPEQVVFKNLPLPELAVEIRRSKVLLASLGGEDGPVSYLDGHALGVPVVCGDDVIGKWANPEAMGLRCTTVQECQDAIMFLLANPDVCDRMGRAGQRWVSETLTETEQERCLEELLWYLEASSRPGFPHKRTVQSDEKFSFRYWRERLEVKLAAWRRGR